MERNPVRSAMTILGAGVMAIAFGAARQAVSSPQRPSPPPTVRLYVFDCGTLHIEDAERFGLKAEEVDVTDMSVGCYLVAHPQGTLVWETGAVEDSTWKPTGSAVRNRVALSGGRQREVTTVKPFQEQLAELGYSPTEVTYLALSHFHWDHTANANAFADATWLVRPNERDAMFAANPIGAAQASTYAALRNSKTVLIRGEEHDVFGDGTVVLLATPGHSPGHQVLYVKLAKTGGVVLSGDLYHYPEERTLNRVPAIEFNVDQTRASRVALDAFLARTGSQLWIEHDWAGNRKLKKAPEYYE